MLERVAVQCNQGEGRNFSMLVNQFLCVFRFIAVSLQCLCRFFAVSFLYGCEIANAPSLHTTRPNRTVTRCPTRLARPGPISVFQ